MFPVIRRRRSSPRARNLLPNNTSMGLVAGTPGTLPTDWDLFAPDSGFGISTQVVGAAVEDGMSCFDIRASGTPTAGFSGFTTFFPVPLSSKLLPCTLGQAYTLSMFVKLQAGALPGSIALGMNYHDSTGAFKSGTSKGITPTSANLGSQRYIYAAVCGEALAGLLFPNIAFNYSATFDCTLRIGLAQCEGGLAASTPQRKASV